MMGAYIITKTPLKRLTKFCKEEKKNLVWDLFDDSFKDTFQTWCLKQQFAPNTISTQFSKMKEWMGKAEEKGLLKSNAYKEWPTKKYDSESIALSEEGIERIFRIDFNTPEVKTQINQKSKIEVTRDLFVLACWTGLRFGDFSDLSKAVFDGEFIRVPTSKTNQLIPLPIHEFVQEIIDKYNGELPKGVDKTHSISQLRKCGEIAGVTTPTIRTKIRGGTKIVEKAQNIISLLTILHAGALRQINIYVISR